MRPNIPESNGSAVERVAARLAIYTSDIRSLTTSLSAERIYRPNSFFSIYVTELFVTMLPRLDQTTLDDIMLAVVCADHYCRQIDHITDAHSPDLHVLHESSLMLMKCVQSAAHLCHDATHLIGALSHYLQEASYAERYLWRHKGKIMQFEEQDFRMLGEKCSVLKLSPYLLCAATGLWKDFVVFEKILITIARGVQLIDDLFDWKEDFEAEYYTYPLVLAAHSGAPTNTGDLGAYIFDSGIADRVLAIALMNLINAESLVAQSNQLAKLELVRAKQSLVEGRKFLRRANNENADLTLDHLKQILLPQLVYH